MQQLIEQETLRKSLSLLARCGLVSLAFVLGMLSQAGYLLEGALCVVGAVLLVFLLRTLFRTVKSWLIKTIDAVPVGYEDEDGFHYGSPDGPSGRN